MDYSLIELPKMSDPRGNLTFLEHPRVIPFKMARVFWTYDVPGGETRGGHAYHKQDEIVIALSGSFDVVITAPDGTSETISLNRSYYGLYIPALTWRHIENFSTNALSLHVSSILYDPDDYIRNFEVYEKLNHEKGDSL